jgi:hypothetical protein
MRVTRTLAGAPDWGNPVGSLYVCSGIRTFQMTDELNTGDDIAEQDGAGRLCLTRKYPDQLKRVNFNIELCDDSRRLKEITGNGTTITVGGDTAGGLITTSDASCSNPTVQQPVVLEVWVENWDCSGPAALPYKQFAFPRVFLRGGDRTFQKGIVPLTLTGFAETGSAFGDGPFGDYDEINTLPYSGSGATGFLKYERDVATLPSSVDCGFYSLTPASAS